MYSSVFEATLCSYGIPTPPKQISSSNFTRWGERAGDTRYFARAIGDGYVFGDWSQGINETWFPDSGKQLTKQEVKERQEKIAASIIEDRKEQEAQHKRVALEAMQRWEASENIGDSVIDTASNTVNTSNHPYLIRKQVQPCGVRIESNLLIIPLYDIDGKLWSLQRIDGSGNKLFISGGRTKGCFYPIGELANAKAILICEGFATGASLHEVSGLPVIVAFNSGNISAVTEAICNKYPKAKIIICGDDDCWKIDGKNIGREKTEQAAQKYSCSVVFPKFPDDLIERLKSEGSKLLTDFNDLHCLVGLEEVTSQIKLILEQKLKKLKSVSINNLLAMDIKPQDMLLHPIIPKQGLGMLYGYRGRGKTFFALNIAYAVATGGTFLKWKAEKPHRVLVVDGEMTLASMQERLANIVKSSDVVPMQSYLDFITPDMQERGIPSLHTQEGQQAIEEHLDDVELVILDNISTLCRNGKENDAESWNPIQEWALSLRRKGISVLFIHHSGKNDKQRGTAKREDVLDTVIALKSPQDYEEEQGVRVEVHYEKHRYFYGDGAKPFEAILPLDGEIQKWQVNDLENNLIEQVIELHQEGVKQRKIATELEISLSKANRLLKQAKVEGKYDY